VLIIILSEAQGGASAAMTGVMKQPAIFRYSRGYQTAGQRAWGKQAACRKDTGNFNKPEIIRPDQNFTVEQNKINHFNKKRQPEFRLALIFYRSLKLLTQFCH
jgi:hypothetical protein